MTSAKQSAWKVAFEKYRDARHAEGCAVFADDLAAAFSAALAAVEEQMPGQAILKGMRGETQESRGWNNCLSTMSERIAALRSEET